MEKEHIPSSSEISEADTMLTPEQAEENALLEKQVGLGLRLWEEAKPFLCKSTLSPQEVAELESKRIADTIGEMDERMEAVFMKRLAERTGSFFVVKMAREAGVSQVAIDRYAEETVRKDIDHNAPEAAHGFMVAAGVLNEADFLRIAREELEAGRVKQRNARSYLTRLIFGEDSVEYRMVQEESRKVAKKEKKERKALKKIQMVHLPADATVADLVKAWERVAELGNDEIEEEFNSEVLDNYGPEVLDQILDLEGDPEKAKTVKLSDLFDFDKKGKDPYLYMIRPRVPKKKKKK